MNTRKKNGILILIVSLCLLIGFIIWRNNNSSSKNNPLVGNSSSERTESNKIILEAADFKIDPLTYSNQNNNEYIETKIYLTDKGIDNISKDSYEEKYDVSIYLIDNENNNEYFSFLDLEWNVNESKEFRLLLEKNDIKDKEQLTEFNLQLEKVVKGKSNSIMYRIQMNPKSDALNTMTTVGILKIK